jgi:hypothetical protein
MELLMSQPGFKYCDEPFNLRTRAVRDQIGLSQWHELYNWNNRDVIEKYIRSFIRGHPCHAKLKHVHPFSRDYRPITHRIVFKILHAGEDQMEWFKRIFKGRIVFLLRHPIPVSLSRKDYPRLDTFIKSDFKRHFKREQIEFAHTLLADGGSKLERGVLSWCLQNAVPLKSRQKDWIVITYEQLVLEPEIVISHLAGRLELTHVDRMLKRLGRPSATTWQSEEKTRNTIAGSEKKSWLIDRWRERVPESEERSLMKILDRFDIDAYFFKSSIPADDLWITEHE